MVTNAVRAGTVEVDGAEIYYEVHSDGDPLVCVNGGFFDHTEWMLAAPVLAESFRVVTFDPRGHSQSGGELGEEPLKAVDDLAVLIELLELAPTNIVTQSGGGLFALHLAARRPELVRSLSMHEPPLLGLLKGEWREAAQELFSAVAARFRDGGFEDGLRYFLEAVGGDWSIVPAPFQALLIANARNYTGSWFDDLSHPIWNVDVAAVRSSSLPMQLTKGDLSPPLLQRWADETSAAFPGIEVTVIEGAGHGAMFEQQDIYIEAVRSLIRRASGPRASIGR